MFSKWYLILFILTLIFFLFVLGYHIYDYFSTRNCQNPIDCNVNQTILFWLDIVSVILLFVLIIGFFFARDKTCEKAQNLQQSSIPQLKASPNKVISPQIQSASPNSSLLASQQRMSMDYPMEQMMMLNDQPVILVRKDSGNPFLIGENGLDIISRV